MSAPELSILVVAHDSIAVLPACLASAVAKTTLAQRRWSQVDAQDQRGYAVFACALLIRGVFHRAPGRLDERFFLFEENIDLCSRATQAPTERIS
jgi:GT2 family glycosyltransferase